MRLHRKLVATAVAALAIPILAVGTVHAAPTASGGDWEPTLVSSEPLYDGSAVRLRYTDGITIVASTGAKVIFKGSGVPITAPDGRHTYDRSVRIIDPHVINRTSSAELDAYRAAGRSVYTDALAAGYSPAEARRQAQPQGAVALEEPPVQSSGCLYSEDTDPDPDYEWSGCYKLYAQTESDSSAWYAAGSGTAHGWGTSILDHKDLTKGYSQITWSGDGAEIIEASPSANVAGSTNCGSYTIALAYIIELSYSAPLCSDGWDVTWNQALHKVEWHGESVGGESDTRSASGANTVRLPLATSTVQMEYEIGWEYSCYFC